MNAPQTLLSRSFKPTAAATSKLSEEQAGSAKCIAISYLHDTVVLIILMLFWGLLFPFLLFVCTFLCGLCVSCILRVLHVP